METLPRRVETWIKDQSARIMSLTRQPLQWRMVVKWPWGDGKGQRKRIQEEYERRKKQLKDLCYAVKAESVPDLQDILCCMVLSECVYKVIVSINLNFAQVQCNLKCNACSLVIQS